MDLTRKTVLFEGCSWFKLNSFVLALGTNLKFYTSVEKGLKIKVRKFLGLVPTFVEVIREKHSTSLSLTEQKKKKKNEAKSNANESFSWVKFSLCEHNKTKYVYNKFRSSHPEVFLGKGVLKICRKSTWEHPCRSVISRKL